MTAENTIRKHLEYSKIELKYIPPSNHRANRVADQGIQAVSRRMITIGQHKCIKWYNHFKEVELAISTKLVSRPTLSPVNTLHGKHRADIYVIIGIQEMEENELLRFME